MRATSHSTRRTQTATLLVLLVCAAISCDAPRGWSNPLGPATQAPLPPAPSVLTISPDAGSIDGDTRVVITGIGFAGATATLGGVTLMVRPDQRDPASTILYSETPRHPLGAVDLIITNASGADTLVGAFTYMSPAAFDFDGDWWAYGTEGQDIPILFSVRNGLVTSVSCDTYETLTLEPPARVSNGEFSYAGDGAKRVTARIVSATQAVGTLNLAPCSNTTWSGEKYDKAVVSGAASWRSLGTGSK